MFMPMWDIGSGSNLDPTRETVKCFCKCEYDNRKAKAKAGLGYGGYDIGSGYEEEHGGSHLGSFLYGDAMVKDIHICKDGIKKRSKKSYGRRNLQEADTYSIIFQSHPGGSHRRPCRCYYS